MDNEERKAAIQLKFFTMVDLYAWLVGQKNSPNIEKSLTETKRVLLGMLGSFPHMLFPIISFDAFVKNITAFSEEHDSDEAVIGFVTQASIEHIEYLKVEVPKNIEDYNAMMKEMKDRDQAILDEAHKILKDSSEKNDG